MCTCPPPPPPPFPRVRVTFDRLRLWLEIVLRNVVSMVERMQFKASTGDGDRLAPVPGC